MAPAAMLHFSGFAGIHPGSVLLRAGGHPAGAARRLVDLHAGSTLASLPRGFLPLAGSHQGQEGPGCLYRYEIRLHRRRREAVWIACWRRYPAGIGWQRRCGPMPLRVFLDRFLDRRRCGLSRSGRPAPV